MAQNHTRKFVDTGGFGVSGIVEFSTSASCWTYLCSWGCHDFDFEGEREATEAFYQHKCRRG